MDNEAVYDEKIAPLIARVIATCKEHGIPVVMSFQLTEEDADERGVLYCDTFLPLPGCSRKLLFLGSVLFPSGVSTVTILKRDADGKVTEVAVLPEE